MLAAWSKELIREEILDALMMVKRPNMRLPPEREEMAADRREQQSYPSNNFAVTAIILVGLIVVIGLAVAFGVVK